MKYFVFALVLTGTIIAIAAAADTDSGAVLDKQQMLDRQTFWDNKDWDWYKENIPFLETPDSEIDTTYYYRWELVTKHLVYGSPESGYNYTEFIDRPGWSGTYGSISCPVGHQLYEVRWLKDKRLSHDYARYWYRTSGAQPRRYSCWLEDGIWAIYRSQKDKEFVTDLKNDMIDNFQGWKQTNYDEDFGMFWQHGMAEGMETNINSRMTDNWFSGAPGYRPSKSAYMYSSALAIANTAELEGDVETAKEYRAMAELEKKRMQQELWDPEREFFFHMFRNDETKKGEDYVIKARTLTHETGPYAGSEHGREEIGFIPWMFNMPDAGYEVAWKFLMDENYFFAEYGPTVTERNDPMFSISPHCCVWSGNSWPYATSQTLKAMANLLHNYEQQYVDIDDYLELLRIYTKTHRKKGEPYLAEACHPDTGSWEGHDHLDHSEHYFHSSYNDLVITGLIGLMPQAEDRIVINPLVPADWDFFALDDVAYHGRKVAIVWDTTGQKYNKGKGLMIFADGKKTAGRPDIGKLSADFQPAEIPAQKNRVNFVVNNDQKFYPRIKASSSSEGQSIIIAQDGAYWYHISPPNRWVSGGEPGSDQWVQVNFGIERPISEIKLYLIDDTGKEDFIAGGNIYKRTEASQVAAPSSIRLEYKKNGSWTAISGVKWRDDEPAGGKPNTAVFPEIGISSFRAVLEAKEGKRVGLTEVEAWGQADLPIENPNDFKVEMGLKNNLAFNKNQQGYPKVTVSYTSQFDKFEHTIDGLVSYRGSHNRWTTFETKNASDWLEIDFGKVENVDTVLLYIWADGGGVKAPRKYDIQYWKDNGWKQIQNMNTYPEMPVPNRVNLAHFDPVQTSKVRIVMTHQENGASGLTEVEIFGND